MFFDMFKAKCPNCEYESPWKRDKWFTWKPNPTWPCKQCGSILEMDRRRGFVVLIIYAAFWLFFELWVKDWSLLVYCLLPVGIFIILSLKRVKIVQSSDQNSDADSQKAPLDKERG